MQNLYIITYFNGDYNDWDWLWSITDSTETAKEEWLKDNNEGESKIDEITRTIEVSRINDAVNKNDIIELTERYIIKPLKRR